MPHSVVSGVEITRHLKNIRNQGRSTVQLFDLFDSSDSADMNSTISFM